MDLKMWCNRQRPDGSTSGRIIARAAYVSDAENFFIQINKGLDREFGREVTPLLAGIIRQFRRDGGRLRYAHLFTSVPQLARSEGTVLKYRPKPEEVRVVDWRKIYANLLGIELESEVEPITSATVVRFVPKKAEVVRQSR